MLMAVVAGAVAVGLLEVRGYMLMKRTLVALLYEPPAAVIVPSTTIVPVRRTGPFTVRLPVIHTTAPLAMEQPDPEMVTLPTYLPLMNWPAPEEKVVSPVVVPPDSACFSKV